MSSTDITDKSLMLHCYNDCTKKVFVSYKIGFESPWLHFFYRVNPGCAVTC